MISGLALSLLFVAGARAAGVVPTAPGPGQSFKEGGECSISWNLDTTGKWTSFSIDLMSGSNTAMNTITNVVKGQDGTKGETTLKWKCPAVTPHSAIYFYQFTQAGADTTWTTRFTITSPTGEVTPPANALQPDGAKIPWGTGQLAGAGAATAPVNTTTTAPSASANTTSLNTPAANTTSSTNSTAGTANTSTPVTGQSGTTTTTPTQSTSSSTGSNSKSPSSSSSSTTTPSKSGSDTSASPSSDASALTLCKSAAVAVTLAVVAVIAC